jgi:Nif-specific regulatory protein
VKVDVRVIAATSRNLDDMVKAETFRADLFYRLAVFPIRLPPLRERTGDITLLADHFVERFNRSHGRSVQRISTNAIDLLVAYHWPGNVRELENCIERAVLLSRDDVLQGHHFPPSLQTADATNTRPAGDLKARLAAFEREIILDALKANNGNRAGAARDLGLTERIMGLRVKRYDIDTTRFR